MLVAGHVLARNIPGISKRVLREAMRDCENKLQLRHHASGNPTFKGGRAIHSSGVSHSGGLGSSPGQFMWDL
jgi:hypothetical protein